MCKKTILVIGLLVLQCGASESSCYVNCQDCFVDPVFVQRDKRDFNAIKALQEAKKQGMQIIETDDAGYTLISKPGSQGCTDCDD